jgi:uncharacterized repeat protein (TIGR02543 family)
MIRSRLGLVAAFALLAAVGCGKDEAPPPPAAPVNVQATAGDGVVSVHWDTAAGATSYDVYWSTATGVTKATGTAIHATDLTVVHEGLTNGATYFYVVTASNAGGEGPESAEVSATPIPAYQPLQIAKSGTGGGTVTSEPAAIDCGTTCSASVATGTAVTLTATPDETSSFVGWSGDCTGTDPCTLTMDAPRSVTATFTRHTHTLAVALLGTGGGAVASEPAGIDCGITCEATFDEATVVTLTATPDGTSTFTGWTGACTGTEVTCEVTIDQAKNVDATFTRITYLLAVDKVGTSGGTVTSEPAGVDCGSACSAWYETGTLVTLTATPNAGSTFAGWSGAGCAGTGTCTVTLDAARSMTATFTYQIAVEKAGTGGGTVSSTPSAISCGSTCSAYLESGTVVTLSATPDATSTFDGWSGGGCTGSGSCVVTADAAKTVSATFTRITYVLTGSVGGSGGGTLTTSPAGFTSCGSACAATFAASTAVTVTAMPDATSTFAGWTGACTGSASCTVTMDGAKTVGAQFTRNSYALSVTKAGDGAGTVTSDLGGINCGTSCSTTLLGLTVVSLTATPNGISAFDGWSGGGCSGTGPCTVTMDAAKTVTASFRRTKYWLGLNKTGTGQGTVAIPPSSCGTSCASYGGYRDAGTVVTLAATPDATSTFGGWGGACSGTGTTCDLTLDADKTVTAGFDRITYPLTVTKTGVGAGTVTSDVGGISCGASCSATLDAGTTVTLTATPDVNSYLGSWAGCDSASGNTCTVSMSGARSVTASFSKISYTLTAAWTGTGGGTISSAPSGISCGATCTASFESGTTVTLTAAPDSTSTFTGWSGACTGTGTCTVTMGAAKSVTAAFTRIVFGLVVQATSGGTVTSSPSGISCGATCFASYVTGTVVTLAATPNTGATFAGWSGAGCSGTGTCQVTMDAAKTVTAYFRFPLTVSKAGAGGGTVTSTPAFISCGATCTAAVEGGTTVTLTATPNGLSTFSSWAGCDSTSGTTCTVAMNAARSVTATFSVATFMLTGAKSGAYDGTVTSVPAGILCPDLCFWSAHRYDAGTVVTLTATDGAASRFTGWSGGGCSGTGTCTTTVDADKTVTANYVKTYPVTVAKAGTGAGTVSSSVGGISCGSTCSAVYDSGTVVTLTASPDATSILSSWSGCDSTSGNTCTVTTTGAKSVTATFTGTSFMLTGAKSGAYDGTVTSAPVPGVPVGISCLDGCTSSSYRYNAGTVVTLTATNGAGSRFTGWSGGGCSGTGTCTVAVDADKTVTASYVNTYTLAVSKAGAGTGTVTSNVGGINCGSTCSATYDSGTTVTLTAFPGIYSKFTGWTGACTNASGTCTVTMSASRSVTATFAPYYPLWLDKVGSGAGTVTSTPAGINCDGACVSASSSFDVGTTVTLTATPDSTSTLSSWTGCDSVSGNTCTVTMTAAKSVTVTFARTTLTVTLPAGGGDVVSSPAGISCGINGSTCSAVFARGTTVTLTWSLTGPVAGFAGWGGACTGTGTCVLTMDGPKTATAVFY